MPKLGRLFEELLVEELTDPEVAAAYLTEARAESREEYLKALAVLVKASQVSKVAKEAGLQRETMYRSFSEQGNPTIVTIDSVLNVLGIGQEFYAIGKRKRKRASGLKRAKRESGRSYISGSIGKVSVSAFPLASTANYAFWVSSSDTITGSTPAKRYETKTSLFVLSGAIGELKYAR